MTERSFMSALTNARNLGQLGGTMGRDQDRTGRHRKKQLEERAGRTCAAKGCTQRLSIYNPAETCWACDGGYLGRDLTKTEWGAP